MIAKPLHLAIVVSHPIQYFAPVYREVAKDASLRLTVVYCTRVGIDGYYDPAFGQEVKWDVPLLEGYESVFLSPRKRIGGLQWRVVPQLLRLNPDVVLFHGYGQPTNLLGIFIAKMSGKKVLMRGDTRFSPESASSGLKRAVKKVLFRAVDGFVTIGSLNGDYYKSFGVTGQKLFFSPFCVDNGKFNLKDAAPSARSRVRKLLEIGEDKKVILSVAKLTAQKRPQDLLEALARTPAAGSDCVVLFAGSGAQESALRQQSEQLGLDVRFLGFINQSKLPELYAASDLFVLPSAREAWGLVINEAMAAGLAVVTTHDVGSAQDLVNGKGTGAVYQAGDVQALAAVLEQLLSPSFDLRAMGRRGQKLIADWDVPASARGMRDAAFAVAGGTAA